MDPGPIGEAGTQDHDEPFLDAEGTLDDDVVDGAHVDDDSTDATADENASTQNPTAPGMNPLPTKGDFLTTEAVVDLLLNPPGGKKAYIKD